MAAHDGYGRPGLEVGEGRVTAPASPVKVPSGSGIRQDPRDDAAADDAASLAHGEVQAFLQRQGGVRHQLYVHLDVLARYDALHTLGQGDSPAHVRGAEEELRAVTREDGVVPPALLARQQVDESPEPSVLPHRAGGGEHLAALEVITLNP